MYLAMLKDRKCINHISSGHNFCECKAFLRNVFMCRTRKRASIYACVAHRCDVNLSFRDYKISVLDEFGRILITFAMQLRNSPNYHRKFCNRWKKNVFVITGLRSVDLVRGKWYTFTTTKTYNGSSSTFFSKGHCNRPPR